MPTFGSLFSGVGGFDLGLERAGWICAFQCEIEPFCQRVLARHWPHIARWTDVRERQGDRHEPIDLLVGGFPCQDLSVAGKRAGLGGERSGLFWEFLRVARELSPQWLLLENVPGLLSSHQGRDFAAVLGGLEDSGYWWAYRILDSQHFGVAQRRRRVFIVGHRGGPVPPTVLFEPEGRSRHPETGQEAGSRVAASLTSGTHGAGVSAPGRRKEDDVNLVSGTLQASGAGSSRPAGMASEPDFLIARPVVGTSYKGHDDDTDTLLVTGPLRSNAYNNSDPTMEIQQLVTGPLGGGNDGIGRRTEDDPNLVIDGWHGTVERGLVSPLCAKGTGGHNADSAPIIAHTLTAPDPKDGSRQDKIPIVLAHTLQAEGADASEDGTGRGTPLIAFDTTQITSALNRSHPKAGDPCHPLAAGAHAPAVTYTVHAQNANVKSRHAFEDGQSRTLDGMSGPDTNQGGTAIQRGSTVRRLTPTECERLQGFPDGWTCLCGAEPYSILNCKCPDSARYRAMGNAVTVPVIEWIGHRLLEIEERYCEIAAKRCSQEVLPFGTPDAVPLTGDTNPL